MPESCSRPVLRSALFAGPTIEHGRVYSGWCIVCSMTHSVGVLGASGYTGAELLRLLAGHPELTVAVVTAESNAGAHVGDLYPALAPVYGELRYDANDP